MSAYYQQCPTCGNREGGQNVYICDKCRHIFCKKCRHNHCFGPLGLFENPKCPVCGEVHLVRVIGQIDY